jgi:glycosyltransferase involved in cell wall biosynthesis
MRRLLTIGHSYVVAENRRLAHEMALAGAGRWEITAIAPRRFRGDLRTIDVERIDGEASALRTTAVRGQRFPHLFSYAAIAQAMKGSWDVVHCWEEPYVRACAQIARHVPGNAVFVPATFQNIDKRYPWPLTAFERASMSRAGGWIAFGETVKTTLERRGAYGSRPVRVIPPGVDLVRFARNPASGDRVRHRLGWTDGAAVVGFLGRFIPAKGVRLLCDALERVKTPCRALFVGGGPLERELRAVASRRPSRIEVVTGIAHHEVPDWLNAMTVLCAPSQTTARWREQFGRMLIEAMACGVPVIASDSGEIPLVVGDAGLIVGEGDVDGWARAIDRLLADPAERGRCSERGLERARERFAWPVVAARHLEFFESLLQSRS